MNLMMILLYNLYLHVLVRSGLAPQSCLPGFGACLKFPLASAQSDSFRQGGTEDKLGMSLDDVIRVQVRAYLFVESDVCVNSKPYK